MNKILFFAHANFLAHFNRPLIREPAEAWEYGPVYREVYRQFRRYSDAPIQGRAQRLDFVTGEMVDYELEPTAEDLAFIFPVIDFYLKLPAWKLVEIAHIADGPWDQVWNHKTPSNPGMLISDELTAAYFKKLSTGEGANVA